MEAPFVRDGIEAAVLREGTGREALRELFRSVAAERGWKPGGDLEGGERTAACVAVRVDGRLAGGVELRYPDGRGCLPLFAAWPELGDAGFPRPAELVLLALSPGHRGTPGLLWTLCAEAWRHCSREGVTDLLAAVPPGNLRIYRRIGWCPEPVGLERDHWGEACLPCRIGIAEVAASVASRARSEPSLSGIVAQAHRE